MGLNVSRSSTGIRRNRSCLWSGDGGSRVQNMPEADGEKGDKLLQTVRIRPLVSL